MRSLDPVLVVMVVVASVSGFIQYTTIKHALC
jgi:hypothetical protein